MQSMQERGHLSAMGLRCASQPRHSAPLLRQCIVAAPYLEQSGETRHLLGGHHGHADALRRRPSRAAAAVDVDIHSCGDLVVHYALDVLHASGDRRRDLGYRVHDRRSSIVHVRKTTMVSQFPMVCNSQTHTAATCPQLSVGILVERLTEVPGQVKPFTG